MLIADKITSDVNMANDGKWLAFGTWLQRERELAEVSQADAAKATPIHVIQLSRIENGHSGVKAGTLESLVEAINKQSTGHKVDIEIAFRKAGFFRENDDTEGLFSGLEKLSPEKQRLAKRQIRMIIESLADEEVFDTDYIADDE